MKKYLWISSIFSTFLIIGGWITIAPFQWKLVDNRNTHIVTVNGAVYSSVESQVLDGTTINSVIHKAHLLLSANINNLNLEEKINKNEIIFVPYKKGEEPKIDARNGLSKSQIAKLGLNKNISMALYELFKESDNWVTWDDINDLPGVGGIIMKRLKKLLIIRNSH